MQAFKKTFTESLGFLLFGILILGVLWLTHPTAASSSTTAQQSSRLLNSRLPQSRPSPTPLACSVCGSEGPQTIYAPLVELAESSGTEINLNCRSPHALDVTPTFYTKQGDRLVGESFQMQPREVKTVDLRTLMPGSIRGRHDLGGMTLSYTGLVLEMWAQLRLMNLSAGSSVDVTFSIQQDKRSEIRNAVWSMPHASEAIIAIGNFSDSVSNATLTFSNGDVDEISVPPFGTQFIRKKSEAFPSANRGGGLTITAHGSTSLIASGAITSKDGSSTSSIRFYDTENVAQPNLYATNFRLKNVKPQMILRNTGTQTISATPRFIPAPGDPNNFIDLPSVALAPSEIKEVDIEALQAAVSGRSHFDHVSIQVLNNGPRGSLIGALNGKDEITGLSYDVPLRDVGAIRNSTGAYPWRLDHDLSTIVSITNVSSQQSEVFVQLNYPGGPYVLDPRKIAAGETIFFDLRSIRDHRVPDRNGNTIPLAVTGGQFKWFVHGAGSGRVIGRAEMLSVSQGVSSSYSCGGGNCPAQFSYAFLDPSDADLAQGDEQIFHALEIDCDGYGCYGPFTPGVQGWQVVDPEGAIVLYPNGAEADVFGFLGGSAAFEADIPYEYYDWDGRDCIDYGPTTGSAYGSADVVKVDSVNPPRGLIGTSMRIIINGKGFEDGDTSVTGDSGLDVDNTTNFGVTSTQISATLTIAANATPGQHHLTVDVGGAHATGDFFVQIPKALVRQDFPASITPAQDSTGVGPLISITDGDVKNISGDVVSPHRCGAYRNYLYQLMDQESPAKPIVGQVTVDETFPPNEVTGNTDFERTAGPASTNNAGYLSDLNSITKPAGQCLTSSTTISQKQHFSVTIGQQTFTLTTIIRIVMGFDPATGYNIDSSFDTQ